jgi:hypothetical protein
MRTHIRHIDKKVQTTVQERNDENTFHDEEDIAKIFDQLDEDGATNDSSSLARKFQKGGGISGEEHERE